MAFDTKLNLSDSKFEQLSGETLSLSGTTLIFKQFTIRSGSTFTILPNHGANKVLTSDANGNASWQLPITGGTGGGVWGFITGILSTQTDLQTCLNGKLATGGTAICATSAIDSLALCGCVPASFLLSGGTASDSSKLGGQLPAYYLNTGSTITCAADSAKLNNKLPAYYLNTGSTSINSLALCGCIPSCFLGATACACDSKCLGGQLPAYYLSTGGTAVCACDSAKLGGILPAGYMLTGATYDLTSPSIFATGGMCSGTVLTGKTAFEILKEILAPELCGVLTAPSEAISANPTGTFEIGCTISTLCITATFSRGSINPQYCSTSAFRSGLANCYAFTGCGVAGSYACTSSPVIKCATGYVICASQTWAVCTCYDCGVQPKGNAGSNFGSPLVAGVSNTASVILSGIYPYYWGKLTNGSRPAVTNSLVTGGTKVIAISAGVVNISFSSASNEYTWFAMPATNVSKACWYVNALDNGKVDSSPGDKYPDECIFSICSGQGCWTGVNYKVYMSGTVGVISSPLCFS